MSVELGLAEGLLELIASTQPKFTGPDNINHNADFPNAYEEYATTGIDSVDASLVFGYLLAKELDFERILVETGYAVDSCVEQGLVFVADDDKHVACRVGAIVDDYECRRFLIELEPPVVGSLVSGGGQRPLADRIRVATYLVRLGSKIVCRIGNRAGFFGDPVGFLSEGVRVLRSLVRLARLEESNDPGDETGETKPYGEPI